MSAVSVPFRAVRATVFAAVCVVLAACGHAWMSPDPLPPWALITAFGAMFVVAFTSAGRERSYPAITGLLVVAQAGLHTLFTWAANVAPTTDAGGVPGFLDGLLCGPRDSAGHVLLPAGWSAEAILRDARIDPALLDAHTQSHGHAHGSGAMSWIDGGMGMLSAHVVAAVITGWWLRRGEAALFALMVLATAPLRVVFAVLLAVVLPVPCAPGVGRRLGDEPEVTAHQTLLRHAVTRRGPPAEYALAC